jgi:5-methylcytosine-specific restriction enzyme subunit McrC
VGQQVRENIVKNRLVKTVCNFEEHGINTEENQFLKLVLEFVSSYLNVNQHYFSNSQIQKLKDTLNYCLPPFAHVDTHLIAHKPVRQHKNVFYHEYPDALRIGNYILKRFAFNINKISHTTASTPPFWIDMSKLFELYVFGKLKKEFPAHAAITYHDTYAGGKETDILIKEVGYKCVVDCKYKPQYKDNTPSLDDKRQLAGYTRLKRVYAKLGIQERDIIKGLIIYSHQDCGDHINKYDLFEDDIGEYVEFFKVGLRLPELS